MKAITTRYHGATFTKGARISATDSDGNRITINYPHELSGEACHRAAADALCRKMQWTGALAGGSTKHGYVFVFLSTAIETPQTYPVTRSDGRVVNVTVPDDVKGGQR